MSRVVEFCCGYGGATAGMLAAGLDMEASYDLWPVAVEQHRLWHPEVPCSVRDVATITPEELAGRLVWASLPCQPWSTANRYTEKRGKKHPHYYSLAHFARQVQHARCALIENVPGLVHTRDGQAELQELERECVRLGLSMSVHLVYSHWFGVQQWRRRAFILIGRNLPLVLIQPGASMGKVDGWAVTATEGKGGPVRVRPGAAVTCHPTGENIHSSKRFPLTVTAAEKRHEWHRAVCATESDTMSATDPRTGEQNFQGRTLEECARLQGCPVPVGVTKTAGYTLVGNLVPPQLAQAIAEQMFVPLLPRAVSA